MDAIATITTTDGGKTYTVPDTRVGNACAAREAIDMLVKAENIRSKKRARFQGMLRGNVPWPKLLRMEGMAERANFSQREAEAFMSAATTPYYALFFKSGRFVQLTLDYGDAEPSLLAQWSEQIANRYQYCLEDYDGLDTNAQCSIYQMVGFGAGPMMWPDDEDWRATVRKTGHVLIPEDASSDVDEWETFACLRSYLPSDLWMKIQNYDAATSRNWNVEECQEAIMNAAPEDFRTTGGLQWEFYESQLRKNSFNFDAKCKRIFVGDLFQKEFTGKISHFIIERSIGVEEAEAGPEAIEPKDKLEGFLYRKIGRYRRFSQIICPFLYDAGPDMEYANIKGAGPKIFDFCSVSDRLNCRMLDGAMKASGIPVRATTSNALTEAPFTDVSGGTVISPSFEVMQQRVQPDLESPLMVKREQSDTLARNTGQYRAHFQTDTHAPTLGQEQMTVAAQSVLAEGDAARYVKNLDRFHKETLRRLLAMGKRLFNIHKDSNPADDENLDLTDSELGALTFFRACLADGIPEEILEFRNFCRIMATRLAGNGSTQMRQVVSDQLLKVLPAADERGRNTILRNHVTVWAGESAADSIFPRYDIPQQTSSHLSVAQMENNFLRGPNAKLYVDPSQDHVTHFQTHMADVGQHAQEIQQGQGSPPDLLLHMEQTGPHTLKHLNAIAGDPTRKQMVNPMAKAWQDMSRRADQLRQYVEQAAKAAAAKQQPPQVDPNLIKAIMEVQGMLGIKRQKMMGEMQLKADKQKFNQRLQDLQAAHGMRLEAGKTATSQTLEDLSTAHGMRLESGQLAHKQMLDDLGSAHDMRLGNMDSMNNMRLNAMETIAQLSAPAPQREAA